MVSIIKKDNKIIIQGHEDNNIKCAKITALCEANNPLVLKNGYCELPYNENVYNALLSINEKLLFLTPSIYFYGCNGGSISGFFAVEIDLSTTPSRYNITAY